MRARARAAVFGLVAALLATLVATTSGPANAADVPATPFARGSGAASASVARGKLFYGGLSLPLGVGTSSAAYTNQQAKALGIALDVVAFAGLVADVPKQLTAASIDSNSGDRQSKGNLDAGGGLLVDVDLTAKSVPLAVSDVHVADVDLPALVRVEGGHSNSTTGVADGKQRRSSSSSEIARVSIANGLVVLEGLRWSANHRSGFEPVSEAAFDLGRVVVAGIPVPVPAGDINPVLKVVNDALKQVGLRVEAPTVTRAKDASVAVSPLRVELANSPIGAQLLGPIIASARPVLAPVFDALTDANKSLGLAGLVSDIVLGVADGSGGVEVGLGGATAGTNSVGFVGTPTTPAAAVEAGSIIAPSFGSLPVPAPGPGLSLDGTTFIDAPPSLIRGPVRCALEAAPRRSGDCRDSNVGLAVGIGLLAVLGLGAVEIVSRRRRATEAAA